MGVCIPSVELDTNNSTFLRYEKKTHPPAMTSKALRFLTVSSILAAFSLSLASSADAQTIRGILMESGSDRRIQLGEMVLVGEGGDTIDVTYSDDNGGFELTSDEPGDFIVLADALGYGAMAAGVFELGPGAEMTIQYRMDPFALPIEDLVVEFNRPITQHSLVRNGFVARFNRGLGHFITPHMIEESPAFRTEDLFRNIVGVSVQSPGFGSDQIRLRTIGGALCDPLIYIDGVRSMSGAIGMTLGNLVPFNQISGIEIYRRPSEIPLEYGMGGTTFCGVIVVWTK